MAALATDRTPHDSHMGLVQIPDHYTGHQHHHQGLIQDHEYHNHKTVVLEEGDSSEKGCNIFMISSGSSGTVSSPAASSTNSDHDHGFVYQATKYNYIQHAPPDHQEQEVHNSVINFKTAAYDNFIPASGSLLSFHQNDYHYSTTTTTTCREDNYLLNRTNNNNNYQIYPKCTNPRLVLQEDFNCIDQTANISIGWLNSEATVAAAPETTQDFAGTQEACFRRKRPLHAGAESMQLAFKKQCNTATNKPKPKSTPSNDPQSIVAKNRRERISERLKVLQDLVPNGSKVDLVTMLEKAISYVKFLQLQVKVLATDEFWPVQGGKAPEIAQVKEAIDAILSSQGDTNSASK